MKTLLFATAACGLLVAGCADQPRDDADAAGMATNDTLTSDPAMTGDPTGGPAAGNAVDPLAMPTATGPGTALGLTTMQLEDADLVDMAGRDLGDVERVVTDASGAVTALRVEIDDSEPDRFVEIPVAGLTALRDDRDDDIDDDDWDLRGDLTRDALMAMPEAR